MKNRNELVEKIDSMFQSLKFTNAILLIILIVLIFNW